MLKDSLLQSAQMRPCGRIISYTGPNERAQFVRVHVGVVAVSLPFGFLNQMQVVGVVVAWSARVVVAAHEANDDCADAPDVLLESQPNC